MPWKKYYIWDYGACSRELACALPYKIISPAESVRINTALYSLSTLENVFFRETRHGSTESSNFPLIKRARPRSFLLQVKFFLYKINIICRNISDACYLYNLSAFTQLDQAREESMESLCAVSIRLCQKPGLLPQTGWTCKVKSYAKADSASDISLSM